MYHTFNYDEFNVMGKISISGLEGSLRDEKLDLLDHFKTAIVDWQDRGCRDMILKRYG
jgi:hypothetical protein